MTRELPVRTYDSRAGRGKRVKILIAEDDVVSRRLLESQLLKWGEEVVAACDGDEAWRLFQGGDFRLVITDWMMPGMDGPELVRRIRAEPRPHYVYTILLSARSQKADVVEGMEAGADDFLTKPFDRDELRVRLRAGERVLSLERTLAEQNRALREAQAALVQSAKLASLGQLAAGIAHEINNPIAFVSNNLAVLRRDLLDALGVLDGYRAGRDRLALADAELAADLARREQEIDLDYVRQSCTRQFDSSLEGLRRVRDIVRNLCDFARLGEAELKDVDLNAALTSTAEILRHEIRMKQIRLEMSLGELPPVLCQPGKVNQVFLNLLKNAVQATPDGGRIELRSRLEDTAAVVEVADHGCGMTDAVQARLFEPFFTTKPVGQGTGLGLSVSYGIVRDHGGAIEVESAPGQGSTFRVRLPLRPPGERRGSPPPDLP
jgi:signal transduction histidine kinase